MDVIEKKYIYEKTKTLKLCFDIWKITNKRKALLKKWFFFLYLNAIYIKGEETKANKRKNDKKIKIKKKIF